MDPPQAPNLTKARRNTSQLRFLDFLNKLAQKPVPNANRFVGLASLRPVKSTTLGKPAYEETVSPTLLPPIQSLSPCVQDGDRPCTESAQGRRQVICQLAMQCRELQLEAGREALQVSVPLLRVRRILWITELTAKVETLPIELM